MTYVIAEVDLLANYIRKDASWLHWAKLAITSLSCAVTVRTTIQTGVLMAQDTGIDQVWGWAGMVT